MTRTFRFDPMLPEGEVATLRRALEAAGWRETLDRDWDLYWDGSLPDAEFFASLRGGRWVNHFPGYGVFGDKGHLHDNLARRWAPEGRFRSIHPRSFLMPADYRKWRMTAAAEPEQLWLVKPRRLSQGREITVVRNPDEVPLGPKWMIQEYIQRPHLLDGYKYVLRFFVLLTSLDPLLCYLHDAGLCKRTSRPYTLDPDSLDDRFVHLTNPAIHRRNQERAWGALNSDHEAYRARLRADGIDDAALFASIRDALVQTVVACREEALMRSRAVTRSLATCFELIGVDVVIDEALRPWVLECNPSPSLEVGAGFDPDAARLVSGAKDAVLFDMVSLLPFSLPSGGSAHGDPESYWRRRAALELSNAGGYQRVWPGPDADRFVPYFPLLRPLDQALAADACPRLEESAPEIRTASRVEAFPLGDGLTLFDPDRRRFYAVNAAGAATWLALADGLTPSEAIAELASASPDSDREFVHDAVWDLLVAWAQSGLLSGFEQDRPGDESPADAPLSVAGVRHGPVLVVSQADDGDGEARIELPADEIRRLVLIEPSPESTTRLAVAHPAAALDALVAGPGVARGLDSARAAALVAWLDGLEIFVIEIAAGAESEARRLADLVCASP